MLPEPVYAIRKPRFSLRLKLTVGLIFILGILFAGMNLFNVWTHRQALLQESNAANETVGRVLVFALTGQLATYELDSSAIKTYTNNYLRAAIIENRTNKDLAFGLILDASGRLVAGRARPELTTFPGDKRYADEAKVLAEIARLEGKLGASMRVKRFTLQVPGKGSVGRFLAGLSTARLEREFRRDLAINLSVFVATLLLLVVYTAFTLGRMVLNPLGRVMAAMREVHRGNLDAEVHITSRDEIGVLSDTYNFMLRGLKEREQLKDAFSRYVSTKVYERLQLGQLALSGEARNATVLFSDIRSFTALSERLAPAEVVAMLNEYFNVMVEIVFKHDGFLNKFIGDALMAVYNVPIDQTAPELRAVQTALEMLEALAELNKKRAAAGQYTLKIGIGINTGPVTAGNIGHVKRLEYTVIGDTVNLAQRIESQTKVTGMPILISQSTYRAVADLVVAQALPPVKVKGKQEPVLLYALESLKHGVEVPTGPLPVPLVQPAGGDPPPVAG